MRSTDLNILILGVLSYLFFLAAAQDEDIDYEKIRAAAEDGDIDYEQVWDHAPDFSNDHHQPFPSLKDDDGNDISVENLRGTRLFGYKGCEKEEANKIDQAFKDFHTLVSQDGVHSNIDWAHAAAVDFFGPSAGQYKIPDDTRKEIQQIYKAANQVWSWSWNLTPPWMSYRYLWIEVRCSDGKLGKDSSDPADGCGDGQPDRDTCQNRQPLRTGKPISKAFSDNTNRYSRITFCNDFFNLDTFKESNDKKRAANQKKRLDLWDNQARCFLHEVTHLDYFVNAGPGKENKSPFVSDLAIKYTVRGKSEEHPVYGPYNARILTNWRDPEPDQSGYYTQRNADNYAFFALAKHVQSKIGDYPDQPRVGRRKPSQEPTDATNGGQPQRRATHVYDTFETVVKRDEDDPPDDMPEYPGCPDRAELGAGAAAESESLSSANAPGAIPTPTPESSPDLPDVKCADASGVRFGKTIAFAAMQMHCAKGDNWDKVIVPPISIGDGEAEDGKEKTWGVTTSQDMSIGTDHVWLGMLFSQESCSGSADFVGGQDDDEKLQDCADKYMKIMDECSDESGKMTGGTLLDACIVYDIRGALEDEKPYDDWFPEKGDFKCEETDVSDIGGDESDLVGTCTCWYSEQDTLTDVFNMPDSGSCDDVDQNDFH